MEVRGWLAGSRFKACTSNPVMGTHQTMGENKLMAQEGSEGQRVRVLRDMRAALTDRVSRSVEMVVTVAMVQELEDNKRDMCGKDMRVVTAAILLAAEEHSMRVEVFDGGARGKIVDRVAEAHLWAVESCGVGAGGRGSGGPGEVAKPGDTEGPEGT